MVEEKKNTLSEDLVLFIQTGNQSYFDSFYHTLYPLAYKVSVLITKNSADAEDVAQTSFYIVFNQLETCRSLQERNDEKLRSWFLSIVYNQSRLAVRTRMRNKNKETQKEKNIQNNTKENQMEPQLENKIKLAVNRLEEKYRTPIILKYTEGLNTLEIATILQMKESTLRVRLRRGLEKLKSLLSTEQHEFEKLIPSISLITFDQYSKIPPTPAFVNKDLINVKRQYASNSSISLKYLSFGIGILASIIGVILLNLPQSSKKPNNQINVKPSENIIKSQPEKINSPIEEKKIWDFTKGNKNNFNLIGGNWDFNIDGMVTTNMKEPEASLLILPVIPSKNFKINLIGKVEFGEKDNSISYVVKGVLIKGVELLKGEEKIIKFISNTIWPKMLKQDAKVPYYPMHVTLYFTENQICTRYNQNGLQSIESIISSEADKCGFLIRDIKVQKIEYEPLSANEIIELKEEVKNTLNKK